MSRRLLSIAFLVGAQLGLVSVAEATPNPNRTFSTLPREGARGDARRATLARRATRASRALGARTQTALRTRHATTTVQAEPDALAQLDSRIANNGFMVRRGYPHYAQRFGNAFVERMSNLRPDQHWIDMGAGEANAINDFLATRTEANQPRVTAIAVTAPPGTERNNRYRYLDGQVVANYSVEQIGQADVITDLFGPSVYAGALDQTVEQYGHLLREGGDAFLFMGDHVTLNKAVMSSGSSAQQRIVRRWIAASSGFDVVDISAGGVVHLRRNADPVRIASLRLSRVQAGDDRRAEWRYDYRFTPDHPRAESVRHGNE